MFYKVAAAFTCFLALGQVAVADEGKMGPGLDNQIVPEDENRVGPVDKGDVGPGNEDVLPGKALPGEEDMLGLGVEDGLAVSKGRTAFPVRVGTWEELKLACENPTQFHLQLPPENIEIECVSYETAWIPDGNGTIGRDCTHKVIARLRSTKIDVSAEEFIFPGTVTSFDCPRFKEVLRVYRKPLQITCEEALTCPQDNLGDLCESAVRQDINANPELVSETDTGRTLDTCQAANPSVCK